MFVSDVMRRQSPVEAMTLLDTLRAARQRHDRVRMVLTGSIGLHLVMRELAKEGHRNRPINDVHVQRVPLLARTECDEVASALLRGVKITPTDERLRALFEASEGHPFVLQHLVDHLRGGEPTPSEIDAALHELLTPPSVLDLGHYGDRIEQYYGESRDLALRVLDVVATATGGTDVDSLVTEVGSTREQVIEVVKDLRDDDYLLQDNRKLHFCLEFVRRHWAEDRML